MKYGWRRRRKIKKEEEEEYDVNDEDYYYIMLKYYWNQLIIKNKVIKINILYIRLWNLIILIERTSSYSFFFKLFYINEN